jgi:hypothetical protein
MGSNVYGLQRVPKAPERDMHNNNLRCGRFAVFWGRAATNGTENERHLRNTNYHLSARAL